LPNTDTAHFTLQKLSTIYKKHHITKTIILLLITILPLENASNGQNEMPEKNSTRYSTIFKEKIDYIAIVGNLTQILKLKIPRCSEKFEKVTAVK